jgi:hypothetical protein
MLTRINLLKQGGRLIYGAHAACLQTQIAKADYFTRATAYSTSHQIPHESFPRRTEGQERRYRGHSYVAIFIQLRCRLTLLFCSAQQAKRPLFSAGKSSSEGSNYILWRFPRSSGKSFLFQRLSKEARELTFTPSTDVRASIRVQSCAHHCEDRLEARCRKEIVE